MSPPITTDILGSRGNIPSRAIPHEPHTKRRYCSCSPKHTQDDTLVHHVIKQGQVGSGYRAEPRGRARQRHHHAAVGCRGEFRGEQVTGAPAGHEEGNREQARDVAQGPRAAQLHVWDRYKEQQTD